jgi:hypothetical protein
VERMASEDPVDDLTRDFTKLNTNRELQAENFKLKAEIERLRLDNDKLRTDKNKQVDVEDDTEDSPLKQSTAIVIIRRKIEQGYRISLDDYNTIVKATGKEALISPCKGRMNAKDRQNTIIVSITKVWKDTTGNEPIFKDFDKVLECLRRITKPEGVKMDLQGKAAFVEAIIEMDREMREDVVASGAVEAEAE